MFEPSVLFLSGVLCEPYCLLHISNFACQHKPGGFQSDEKVETNGHN